MKLYPNNIQRIGTISLTLALTTLFSCSSPNEYSITGTVPKGLYEGEWIYSTPAEGNFIGRIDSCRIKDSKFHFTGNKEEVRIIRLKPILRLVAQEMLVVTEPGTIHVAVNTSSKVWGTPQNDTLMQWKNAVMQYINTKRVLLQAQQTHSSPSVIHTLQQSTDSINKALISETQRIIRNNKGTTLAKFLQNTTGQK